MSLLPGTAVALSGGGAPAMGLCAGFGLAWELFLVSHSIRDFEHFSGVSAGAVPAAYWAAGLDPIDIVRGYFGHRTPVLPFTAADIYAPNWRELRPLLAKLPSSMSRAVGRFLGRGNGSSNGGSSVDLLRSLLPTSVFVSDRMAEVVRKNLASRGVTHFKDLQRRLSVRVLDVRSGRPVVCGHGGDERMPIALAVQGSMSFPIYFNPVQMDVGEPGILALDGGATGTTFEVQAFGQKDIVLVLDATQDMKHSGILDLIDAGETVLRHLLRQRNAEEIAEFTNQNPKTHVVHFDIGEAARGRGFISFTDAIALTREGFEATRDQVAADFDYLSMIFGRHGVVLNPEMGKLRFDDVIAHGHEIKAELRRRLLGGTPARAAPAA
jgi:predicted acylesterase/phospholipase RssA